jgi:protein-S-isoprenylcysteine O-methyltransferase Ste14
MNTEHTFRAAFWTLVILVIVMRLWFAFRVSQAGERLLPDRAAIQREGWGFVMRCVLSIFLVALVSLLCLHRVSLRGFGLALPDWLRWAGFALGLASLGLWTWTHVALGQLWSAQLQLHADHHLVITGPYARVRHPMYTAILGWLLGLGLVTANWIPLAFTALVAVFLGLRAPREEQMMLERFGDQYRQYMKRTGRFLPVPCSSREM